MEENVALDTAKQRKFEKSIKGIKKLIKKTKSDPDVAVKDANNEKRKRKERGLVYLSHIPHGFYEHEMAQYFKQFGVVTNARVIRSKRTGGSRGCAFVEFREPAVAQIVAETMNNYLMGKRLIKAAYIPPEKQRPKAMRKNWSSAHNPGTELRQKMKKAYNANKGEKGELLRARKILANLSKTKKKLSEMGIKYDFFVPVDVPEEFTNKPEIIETVKNEKENKVKEEKKHILTLKKKNKKDKELITNDKQIVMKNKNEKCANLVKNVETKVSRVKKTVDIEAKKECNKKQKCLKARDMKPLGDFIKVQNDSDGSESSEQFDSDEFEKMLENEDDLASASEDSSRSEDDESEGGQSVDESIEVVLPSKKNKKAKLGQINSQIQQQKNIVKENKQPPSKRKVAPKIVVSSKKPKFEKQVIRKSNNKQFKKKK